MGADKAAGRVIDTDRRASATAPVFVPGVGPDLPGNFRTS